MGLDIYQLSSKLGCDFNLAYQCKGFETRFEKSQYDQCISSLDAVKKSKKNIDCFYLVINLKGKLFDLPLRKQLESDLKDLTVHYPVKKAVLLDAEGFTEYLCGLILKQLEHKIDLANKRFGGDYRATMHQEFYYEAIPFINDKETLIDPNRFIINTIKKQQLSQHPDKKSGFLILSEFGFGKTSLLLHLFGAIKKPYVSLYIPVALFGNKDLQVTAFFYQRMLEIVEGQEIDFSDAFNKLASKLLNYLLGYNNNKTILLLDGLDEHEGLYSLDLLKNFFNNLTDVKAKIIFSVRKEMWDERRGNFMLAMGKSAKYETLLLTEWTNDQILGYLDRYMQKSARFRDKNLQEFRLLVFEDNYEAYYGDVPKRPLFLEMIVSDIQEFGVRKRNMSELYINFFQNKFTIDRTGTFSVFSTKRPLQKDEDSFKMMGLIFTALSRIARRMARGLDNEKTIIMQNYIEEYEVASVLNDLGLMKTHELVVNSVLIPSGVRKDENLTLRFAHKSFQEFFFARAIYLHLRHNLEENEPISDLDIIHSEGVNKFLVGFLQTDGMDFELEELKEAVRTTYPDYSPHTLVDYILNIPERE